ncbi:hypothetical protein FF912_04320 [Bordetella pertussis]|nr:hypothetical protein FF912_04320 [Bordetella pertussis]
MTLLHQKSAGLAMVRLRKKPVSRPIVGKLQHPVPLIRNRARANCEDSIGCMHGSSEPDLRNWKSPTPQFTQGARPDEHP